VNLEDLSREELIALIKKYEAKKKYGLVWEDEKTREDFESKSAQFIPLLSEVKKQRIISDPKLKSNYLIEGDNYFALSILKYSHFESIDLIYIDPPYNTGNNDFKYNDRFVEKEDTFRHSMWLSFMSKRLRLAKDLLSSNGVIFVSIGDDEQANLRLLMDDIFGEANFVACVPRLAKTSSDKGTFYAPSKDYVLAYRHPQRQEKFNDVLGEEYRKRFKEKDERGDFATVGLYQAALDPMRGCINQRYWIECPDGSFIIPPGNVFPKEVSAGSHIPPETRDDKVWRWSFGRYLKDKDKLVFKKSKRSPMLNEKFQKSDWNVDTKYYLEDREETGKRPRDWMDSFLNTQGSNEITKYGLEFSYPKPTSLIKYLIQISHSSKDINVLDFFAGSGTTGDAVLQLNRGDGGNRQFILVTNNEDNICDEVTYPRLKKAMKGYKTPKGESIEALGGNLNCFKTKFLRKSLSSDEQKIAVTENCVDLLCFKEGIFDEVSSNESFSIFKSSECILGIYHSYDNSDLEELKNQLNSFKNMRKKAYVFTFDDSGLNPNDFLDWKGISLEPIPQKILEVLRGLYA
jgi:adenine-specific DNA-methyltransferase